MVDLNVYNLLSTTVLRIIVAVVILIFGLIFGGFFSKLTKKILNELEINKILSKETSMKIPLEQTLSSIVKYVVYFIALMLALEELGLTTTIIYILFIIILVILVLLILLSFKDYLPNLVSGFVIHNKKKLRLGDYVSIAGTEGEITEITTTDVRIKTKTNEIMVVPNSMFFKKEFKIRDKSQKN
ncbi:MAG: mechanosensitive ion channel family protein [Nanoarchaeota archaeon]|nr:mechanosensitive ion channel family protein [Nanoarchaeota archaeon]